jgi:hypothetical protein
MISENEIATLNPQQRVIEHIQLTDAALKHAADQELQLKTAQAKVANVIPDVLKMLLETQSVRPEQTDIVRTKLSSHYDTLDLLYKVAKFLNDRGTAASGLGQPAPSTGLVKQAAEAKTSADDEAEALAFISRLGG